MTEVDFALIAVALLCAGGAYYLIRRTSVENEYLRAANLDLDARARFVEEFAPVPLVMFDKRGLVRRVNPAAQRLLGYTERELYGQTILRIMPQSPEARKGEVEVRCKNGSTVRVRFDAARADTPGKEIFLFLEVINQSDSAPSVVYAEPLFENDLDSQPRPSLRAVEGVVNRIVRQFEGLLTTINGYTELAMHSAPEGSPVRKDLEEIAAASDTASNLSRNLLAFSGNQAIPVEIVELNSILGAMESGIRDAVRGTIHIEQTAVRTAVLANADCLRQVVLLLARSAHHRATVNGSISIATDRQTLEEPKNVYTGRLPAAAYCILSVTDSGPALRNGALEHLFEPLFLDPELVGVELAPIYGIVRSLGGWIDVKPGQISGNTFEVFLPYSGDPELYAAGRPALVN